MNKPLAGLWLWMWLWLCCQAATLEGPIDLSWPYDETASDCPGGQDFQFLKRIQIDQTPWHTLNTFAVAEHCGTHIDAPYHFNPQGITVEQIPLEKLLVKGVFIDASEETGDDVNYTVPLSKLEQWEQNNGALPDNSVVLVKLGWGSRYADKARYLGKTGTDYRHPGLAPELAQYLVRSGKVVGVGVDCSSVDPGYDTNFTSHVLLTAAGLYILENLYIPSSPSLPPVFRLVVAPMKIAGGSGGPVRLIALPDSFTF